MAFQRAGAPSGIGAEVRKLRTSPGGPLPGAAADLSVTTRATRDRLRPTSIADARVVLRRSSQRRIATLGTVEYSRSSRCAGASWNSHPPRPLHAPPRPGALPKSDDPSERE